MRVNTMIENDSKKAYSAAINRQESVLFDEHDMDGDEDKVTYANRPGSTESEIVESSSSLASEADMSTYS